MHDIAVSGVLCQLELKRMLFTSIQTDEKLYKRKTKVASAIL